MKSKPTRMLKDLRAQRESIYGRRFANQSTLLDLMRLANETLPNATPLTPEERVSINEFLVPFQMTYSLFLKMADDRKRLFVPAGS
jgi:hypothetical protein